MKLNDQLIALIDRIDEVLKNDQTEDLFSSTHGISFQKQYEELLSFMGVSTIIPATFSLVQPMSQYFSNPMKLKELISEIFALSISQAQLSSEKRKLAQESVTKIETQLEKMINIGLEEFQRLTSLSDEFNRIMGTEEVKEISQGEKFSEESDLSQILQNIRFIKRINASFVFSLYALIDYYTKGLIIDVISMTPQERVYQTKGFDDAKKNPQNAVSWSLNQLEKGYPKTKQVLGSVIGKKGWKMHKNAFKSLSTVRHPVAHKKPILSLMTLQETFNQYQDEVSQKLQKLKEQLLLQQLPSIFRDSVDTFIQELETFFFLQTIGNGCFRYLAVIDRIVHFYINGND
ncbi:MAG: hypothetical protein ACE5OZ_25365 [Candidatus Heimdallarchaeota archaeon]